jgi:hypothetical protein
MASLAWTRKKARKRVASLTEGSPRGDGIRALFCSRLRNKKHSCSPLSSTERNMTVATVNRELQTKLQSLSDPQNICITHIGFCVRAQHERSLFVRTHDAQHEAIIQSVGSTPMGRCRHNSIHDIGAMFQRFISPSQQSKEQHWQCSSQMFWS